MLSLSFATSHNSCEVIKLWEVASAQVILCWWRSDKISAALSEAMLAIYLANISC